MEWNDGTDSNMKKMKKKKKTTTTTTTAEAKKREWVEEPVKPETLFSVAFPSSLSVCAVVLFLLLFLFCSLAAIKLQSALVGASKRKIHIQYT